ncbi:hypothetical protein OM33_08390 [Pseudoalteromonas piratica]|uniref:Uncharacterized protein n=1 Tax=Pseudoalteromonas piratica TaxID=1348114 RepID=A0A0A7EEY5_9GAMM|nr:hypothetical protein OM33_08390 [Pseudoalteromonas piratica]
MTLINYVTYDFYTFLTALSALVALLTKDAQWFLYSMLVCLFMFLGWQTHEFIKSLDPFIAYRYFYYSICELLFLFILLKLWSKGLIINSQYFLALALSISLIITWLLRYIDRQYFDLTFTAEIYGYIIPTINGMFAISCSLPGLTKLLKKYKG